MRKMLRTSFLSSLFVFGLGVPLAMAQAVKRLPEGGSDLAYIAMVGMSCVGAIWYKVRR